MANIPERLYELIKEIIPEAELITGSGTSAIYAGSLRISMFFSYSGFVHIDDSYWITISRDSPESDTGFEIIREEETPLDLISDNYLKYIRDLVKLHSPSSLSVQEWFKIHEVH